MRRALNPWLVFALQMAAGLAILVACLAMLDFAKLADALNRIQPAWFLLAVVLSIVGTVLVPAVVTRRALEIERIRMSIGELTLINLAIRLYVLILPRPASIAIRWARYRRRGSGHDALALMVFERLVQLFVMMLVGTAVIPVEWAHLSPHGPAVLAASAAATVVAGAALLPFIAPRTTPWLDWLCRLCDRHAPAAVARTVRRLLDAVTAFQALPRDTSRDIVFLSLLAYVLFIVSAYVVAVAMQLDISLPALAWIRPLVFLLTLLPFTIGGLGVREIGFIGLLGLYGVPGHEAMAFSLVVFATQVAIGVLGMLVEVWGVAGRRWRTAA
jgi:uncharacterized protein (TIRG00374 family)